MPSVAGSTAIRTRSRACWLGSSVPRRAVIGPWAHAYPHLAVPGPGYDFLAEVVRWFDHWLKGADNGAMDEPMLRAWMGEALPAAAVLPDRPGRWVGEDGVAVAADRATSLVLAR